MLEGHFSESQQTTVTISSANTDAFELLVGWIHGDKGWMTELSSAGDISLDTVLEVSRRKSKLRFSYPELMMVSCISK